MNENLVYETILKRRSIRSFLETPVECDKVKLLLKAAMAAPSACNLQPWAFIVVDDKNMVAELKKTTTQGDYNAPLAIVVCGINKHIPWDDEGWRQECGGAAQNIMLTCVEMGLSSVCVGGYDEEALCDLLDIPNDVHPMCILEIGYPAYEREPLSWYSEDAVYYNKFDPNRKRKLRTLQDLQDDIEKGIV